jgi:hypothetical protein
VNHYCPLRYIVGAVVLKDPITYVGFTQRLFEEVAVVVALLFPRVRAFE